MTLLPVASRLANQQPIEKYDRTSGQFLDVYSIFPTIQGEGPFVGCPALFIRLAGCNLQCPQCDTDYTVGRQPRSVDDIALEARESGLPLVVITGGEPFRQNLDFLLPVLLLSHTVQIETNGTLPVSWTCDDVHIVVSPKTGKVDASIWRAARYAKYVLDARSVDSNDGLPLRVLGHTANPRVARPPDGWDGVVYVQPADNDRNEDNLQAAIASVQRFPNYRLCLQTHKLLGLP